MAANSEQQIKSPSSWMLHCVLGAMEQLPSLAEKKGITKQQLESLYGAGFQLYETQCYQEAADLFRLLCFYEPRVPRYWIALGGAYQHIKCHDNALAAFAIASLLDPSNPEPKLYAAHSCIDLMNLYAALECVSAAVKLAQYRLDQEGLYRRALALEHALLTQDLSSKSSEATKHCVASMLAPSNNDTLSDFENRFSNQH